MDCTVPFPFLVLVSYLTHPVMGQAIVVCGQSLVIVSPQMSLVLDFDLSDRKSVV